MPKRTLGILGDLSNRHKQKIFFSANFLRGITLAPSAPQWSSGLWHSRIIITHEPATN